jgi:hypothetical protein
VTQAPWIYERTADGSARFVLGEVGDNPLLCFGINPSTAVPNSPDRTVSRVIKFARDNGYDGWAMLNVYPQISTDPKKLDRVPRPQLQAENEHHISRVIDGRPLSLLAAWGGLITSRPYLRPLLRDIVKLTYAAGCNWLTLGELTKDGHPRHPLYERADAPLRPFSMKDYS